MVDSSLSWRCFHCDEVFNDAHAACMHFGYTEDSIPACKIKAGAEGSILEALRRAEADAERATVSMHNESSEGWRAYHDLAARVREQVTASEELGYERGLHDALASHTSALASLLDQWREGAFETTADEAAQTALDEQAVGLDVAPIIEAWLTARAALSGKTRRTADSVFPSQEEIHHLAKLALEEMQREATTDPAAWIASYERVIMSYRRLALAKQQLADNANERGYRPEEISQSEALNLGVGGRGVVE